MITRVIDSLSSHIAGSGFQGIDVVRFHQEYYDDNRGIFWQYFGGRDSGEMRAVGVEGIKKVEVRYTASRIAERGESYWDSGLGMAAK